jgi:hypothetical protein
MSPRRRRRRFAAPFVITLAACGGAPPPRPVEPPHVVTDAEWDAYVASIPMGRPTANPPPARVPADRDHDWRVTKQVTLEHPTACFAQLAGRGPPVAYECPPADQFPLTVHQEKDSAVCLISGSRPLREVICPELK